MRIVTRSAALLLSAAVLHFSCFAASWNVVKAHEASAAEQAFLQGHFEQAEALYRAQLAKAPGDEAATEGLAKSLLRQQKIAEADTVVTEAIAKNGNSALLYTALGEVQYREGKPWLAAQSVVAAAKLDLCYPRMHLLSSRLSRINSNYATAAKELALAHSLDPHDPDIRRSWMATLPLAAHITELEAYLASDNGEDSEDLAHMRLSLEALKKRQAEPRKPCRLVSTATTTEIPFSPIMRDATRIRAFGLDVKLEDRNARLEIDTGASGLIVSHSVAERAHLQRYTEGVSSGVGSKGERSSYRAYAESIRIGGLEFQDCEVDVIDKLGDLEIDGLIGMDVFSRFLVTLDFPMRKLALGVLPKRPEDAAPARPSLETAASQGEADDSGKSGDRSEGKTDDKSRESSSGADPQPAQAPRPTVRGPRDRYIAPEMQDWTRVYRSGHDLVIQTLLNNAGPKLFILDTGAFTTSISPAVARSVTKVGSSNVRVRGLSGEVDKVLSADEIEFRFGNIRQKGRDVVAFESPAVSKNLGMEIAGFLGATTLGQMTMSIDYRDGLVKFEYDAKHGYKYPGLP